jgi:hypothetical protein
VGGGFVRRKLRLRRPGHATVVAYLALFIALGGGTALAAVVVSSNSQIGPNTIYGHNAPAGANKNINLDSVTGADVNEATLARVPSAANGARKFDFDVAKSVNPPLAPILSLNEMSLQARCATNSSSSQTVLEVYVASSVAADLTDTYNASLVPTTHIGAGGSARLLNLVASSGYQRAEGQFTYRNAPRVIGGSFHAIANQGTGRCQVNGTETQAPN